MISEPQRREVFPPEGWAAQRWIQRAAATLALLGMVMVAAPLQATQATVGDLTHMESEVPLRLMGYGLVVGLEGTGDRALGGRTGTGFTVRSVANLLRRFDVEVPEEMLRTRNVAAVLVTGEASPWLRPGGRFPVQVSSIGDATSLQGGVLWMTPLVADPGGMPLAAAQGVLTVPTPDRRHVSRYRGGTTGEIPDGAVMEVSPQATVPSDGLRLFLKRPNPTVAEEIVEAINEVFGDGVAEVEDPGSVRVLAAESAPTAAAVAAVPVQVGRTPTILVDSRAGTVVAGGNIQIGAAAVTHEGITITIDPSDPPAPDELPASGEVRLAEGASVQDVVSSLHAVGATSREVTAILRGLREVGAFQAEVLVR